VPPPVGEREGEGEGEGEGDGAGERRSERVRARKSARESARDGILPASILNHVQPYMCDVSPFCPAPVCVYV